MLPPPIGVATNTARHDVARAGGRARHDAVRRELRRGGAVGGGAKPKGNEPGRGPLATRPRPKVFERGGGSPPGAPGQTPLPLLQLLPF